MPLTTAPAQRSAARGIGFNDLPGEIRNQIYELLLPGQQKFLFSDQEEFTDRERDIQTFCRTCKPINRELWALIYKTCGAVVTVRPDRGMRLPASVQWDRFQWIEIQIMEYHGWEPSNYAGIEQIVGRLRTAGQRRLLPPIEIEFEEQHDQADGDDNGNREMNKWSQVAPSHSSYHWRTGFTALPSLSDRSQDSSADGGKVDAWLRMKGDDDRWGNPIVIEILDHFLDLPRCISSRVGTISNLQTRKPGLRRHDPRARIFDADYMDDMRFALALWMSGDRRKLRLPKGVSEYEEPRLEQIAYTERDGVLYCDEGFLYSETLEASSPQ